MPAVGLTFIQFDRLKKCYCGFSIHHSFTTDQRGKMTSLHILFSLFYAEML